MNAHCEAKATVTILVLVMVSNCLACDVPPSPCIAPIGQAICVGQYAIFSGYESFDNDEDGEAIRWAEWWIYNPLTHDYHYFDESDDWGDLSTSIYLDTPGFYEVDLYVKDDEGTWSTTYSTCYVLVVRVTVDSPECIPYAPSTPVTINYTIELAEGWTPEYVNLQIGTGQTIIRTKSLPTSIGSQSTTWDGKKDDGTWASPGAYVVGVEVGVDYPVYECYGDDTSTVVKTNVNVSGLLESEEEDPGLYINANWDDDDRDGWTDNEVPPNATYTGDKSDSYVYHDTHAPTGDNDFRTFSVEIEPTGLSGNVEITYSAGIAIWETMTKKKLSGESSSVASGTQIPAADLPAVFYVEGVSGSTTFRDKEIRATYLPCGATDVAKLTVFEVDLTGFFGYANQQSDNEETFIEWQASSNHTGRISWDDANADGEKVDQDSNCSGFHNCMECQGTVKPSGVTNQVAFDMKRDKWVRTWTKWDRPNEEWHRVINETNPWVDDDGPGNSDEDLTVSTSQHIYSIDGPGLTNYARQTGDDGFDLWVYIGDFREYVKVNIGGTLYQCSDYYKWHSKLHAQPKNDWFMTRSDMSLQALGAGWIAVPDNP